MGVAVELTTGTFHARPAKTADEINWMMKTTLEQQSQNIWW